MKTTLLSLKPVNYLPKLASLLIVLSIFKADHVNGQLITNISASTGNPYALSTFNANVLIYTDRTYKTTSNVPSYLLNAPFIKTPNDDNASKSSVSFTLTDNATVYVVYDPRATALPAWLSSWQKLPEIVGITDETPDHLDIYKKSFLAGTVTLGGNLASPAVGAKNMYFIVAVANTSGNNPPTVNITSPANNSTFNTTSITINASATDAGGTVSKVDFYRGTALLGTDNSSPYSYTWNGIAPGTYSLTAKATDNGGLSSTSSAVSVTVTNNTGVPSVSITKPFSDTTYLSAPATVYLEAATANFANSIKKVEFFQGTTLLNTQGTSPFAYTWNNVAAGTYSITAKATDIKGVIVTSPARSITVSGGARPHPSVVSVNPPDKSTNVDLDASISTNILKLPNGGINNNTITSSTVYLTDNATGKTFPSNVNGTGGGDAITLVPVGVLKVKTVYKLHITAGVKDLTGTTFTPYTSTFTTNSAAIPQSSIQFDKISLLHTSARHTCVTVGPDNKLYALVDNGLIERYSINNDGTLSVPQLIYSLQDSYGSRRKTLAVGFAFAPSSTASNLIAYVTHCNNYVFQNAPDWDDKLTKLSGANLQNAQDILINLPRSAKDHVTNSIAFGPDGALYFTQGASCAMGQADQTWNFRDEHLLTAAVLRLDLTKLGTLPLNVKTIDGGGTYNPYAANAPLTIYASGVRNSYDLVWHSNGILYAATNGSAAGGNTPTSVSGTKRPDGSTYNGPAIVGLTNVQQTQEDFLYRIVKGGYYGHPNPSRGEYVMNGGNPTSSKDNAEVTAYPVGTMPDANWRGNIFNFKNNASPDGFLEYKNNAFNGGLKRKLLVVRYSAHDDILTLTPGTNNNIASSLDGASIQGFTGFIDPLDITEDVRNGNLYISEYGGDSGKITLLRPASSARSAARTTSNFSSTSDKPFNTVSGCDAGIEVVIAEDLPSSLLLIKKPKISPNPIQTKFNIQFPNSYQGDYTMQIVDISGRIYQVGKINLKGGTNIGIDISGLSLKPGNYFLKVIAENKKSEVFKFIITGN